MPIHRLPSRQTKRTELFDFDNPPPVRAYRTPRQPSSATTFAGRPGVMLATLGAVVIVVSIVALLAITALGDPRIARAQSAVEQLRSQYPTLRIQSVDIAEGQVDFAYPDPSAPASFRCTATYDPRSDNVTVAAPNCVYDPDAPMGG